MHDTQKHDHSLKTHSAKCDVVGCEYVAKIHAHDDDETVEFDFMAVVEHVRASALLIHMENATKIEEITEAVH